ncbi:hypothetical protein ACGFJT_37130 [Actinomadura geliboluensis]|uniref:hypothetical protein n=1 Tax=Actinomadura geliboluensis TaxID=882440 RepID=UPI00371C4776
MAYVEIYAGDDESVVNYFVRSLLFDQIAVARDDQRRSTLLRSGSVQVIITTPTTGVGPVADHLARHGDGVADVAVYDSDLDELVMRAQFAGVQMLEPVGAGSADGARTARIAGAGSVHHTLIDTTSRLPPRLPPGFAWEAEQLTLPGPATSRVSLARPHMIDHLTWCVPAEDLERATAQYRQVFQMRIAGSDQLSAGPGAVNGYVLAAGVTFVLLAPDRPVDQRAVGPVAEFLDRNRSAGVHHVAFATRDIVAAARMHVHSGSAWMPAPEGYHRSLPAQVSSSPPVRARLEEMRALGVLVDHDGDGLLYQIVGVSPHPRGTLRYELIQREGAAGFGRRSASALLAHQPGPMAVALPSDDHGGP